jgi:signal transduction histidine kinase
MSRRLLLGFLLFATLVVVVFEVPLGLSLASNARATALTEVQNDGTSLGLVVSAALDRGDVSSARAVVTRFARVEHAVVVVLSNRGAVLVAGKGAREDLVDPTTGRILRAAGAGRASGEEGSNDPDDDFLYAVVPLALRDPPPSFNTERGAAGSARLVLLVAEPASALHAQIQSDAIRLALFGMGVLALAVAAGAVLARSLTRPLSRIESTVASYGHGKLDARAPADDGPPELRALGSTVNEMAGRLEELLQTQRSFVADASHQLRTPLTALHLRLENLEGKLGPQDAETLAAAIAETDRLSHVIDGLLVLARADGSRPERVPADAGAVVAARIDAWSALAAERGVGLSASTERPAMVLAGPGYLEQILDNLLANALDATPSGTSVRVEVDADEDVVDVHVVDTGRGMSAEERVRAFDRFWRSENASPDGTGLGLAIVAQLVRASGGTCWLDAGPDGGTDAVVRLPRAR